MCIEKLYVVRKDQYNDWIAAQNFPILKMMMMMMKYGDYKDNDKMDRVDGPAATPFVMQKPRKAILGREFGFDGVALISSGKGNRNWYRKVHNRNEIFSGEIQL